MPGSVRISCQLPLKNGPLQIAYMAHAVARARVMRTARLHTSKLGVNGKKVGEADIHVGHRVVEDGVE